MSDFVMLMNSLRHRINAIDFSMMYNFLEDELSLRSDLRRNDSWYTTKNPKEVVASKC